MRNVRQISTSITLKSDLAAMSKIICWGLSFYQTVEL